VLFFEFSGNCWLEVEDAEGVAIYKDLNRNGDALRITGAAPFSILLGKAPAARLQFNGNTVDIERYTTADDTAKVRLTR
jgi:cytoskeleton protein RodZ